MSLSVAFAGFRHGHIHGLYSRMQASSDVVIAAACEEDAGTRSQIADAGKVKITHDDIGVMLDGVECDIVAIGDTYARRGSLAIRALERGRHVISDKPLCTEISELQRIEELAERNKLCVGMMLSMRSKPILITLRRLLIDGVLGEVINVSFSGQHPLNLSKRAAWYFQPGCHGGTINDIAVHGVDAIEWFTGRSIAGVVAARVWNAKTPQFPHFQDCAQMMLRLDNGGGVLGDVSYLAPDNCPSSAVPQYWRFICHGSEGVAETDNQQKKIFLATHKDESPRWVAADTQAERGYLEDFLDEVRGRPVPEGGVTTLQVLRAARTTLDIQAEADKTLEKEKSSGA